LGETPGVGVDPGLTSVVDEGDEGFVPAALGCFDLSLFSSARFSSDSASESVSS